eukprot:UN01995
MVVVTFCTLIGCIVFRHTKYTWHHHVLNENYARKQDEYFKTDKEFEKNNFSLWKYCSMNLLNFSPHFSGETKEIASNSCNVCVT